MSLQLPDEKYAIKPDQRHKNVPKHLNVTDADQFRFYVEKGGLQRHQRYECDADECLDYLQPTNFRSYQLPDEQHASKPEKRHKKVSKHLNVTEIDQLRNYRCHCGRTYVEKGSLQRHQRYECGKEPSFKCTHCSYASHLKSNLNRHKRVHI